jgi:soluble lytic murein transglycosylase
MPPKPHLVLLTVAVLVFAAACGGDDSHDPSLALTPIGTPLSTDTGEPTEAPGLVLTPTAFDGADFATGSRLETEGDIERAAAAYISVAARGGPDRNRSTLAAARLLLELERPKDVRILLEPFVSASPVGDDLAAHYLLARSYAALKLWTESLAQYDAYIQSGRPAAAHALLDRGYVLLELGRTQEAVASIEQGLAQGPAPALRRTYVLALAQSYERMGEWIRAIDGYRALIDLGGFAGDMALALSRIIAIKQIQSDPSYHEELKALLAGYPASSQAMEALQAALQRGEPIDPTIRGLVHYRHNDYTSAEPAFREQIELAPDSRFSAEAYFYLGAIQEARRLPQEALASYARVPQLNPESHVADDALWWSGRILEDDGRYSQAAALYERLLDEYPRSQFAADAAFRDGMLAYKQQTYVEAAAIWRRASQTASRDSERRRFSFWQAKALLKSGSVAQARLILEGIGADHAEDYFSMRADALLRGRHEVPKGERESRINLSPNFDWQAAEQWLEEREGRSVTLRAWESDPRWRRAQELWRVGRVFYGDSEVYDLMETYSRDPAALYSLSREFLEQGRITVSTRAGLRLLRALDGQSVEEMPKALLSLAYPAAFGPAVEKFAREHGVSPLLMLAFIRQESLFDPRAISPVGALGLTQVLPGTGEEIARELGVNDFASDQLLHAGLNLRFGAKYMADQVRRFDGEIFVAFAAYNAGPAAAARWRELSGSDADLFFEAIDYAETRHYVEIVSENYAIYRYLYGGAPKPNLPE